MSSNGSSTTIFVGSSIDLEGLAASSIAAPLLAAGDIGLYGHMEGIVNSYNDGTEGAVLSEWAGTGAGLTETTQLNEDAVVSFTVRNTTAAAITIAVGTRVSASTGAQYQVLENPDQAAGWSAGGAGDGSLGFYTVPAGQTVTLRAQALQDGPSGNLLDDQLTSIGVAGATITSSTMDNAAEQWSAGTVTLHNSSATSVIVWEGTELTGTNGTYHVGVSSTAGGFVATDADGSSGYYQLAAGASVTVPVESDAVSAATQSALVAAEDATEAGANSITGGALPGGVTVTASSALVATGVSSAAGQGIVSDYGPNTGFFSDAQIKLWTTNQGYNPTEDDVNTFNDYVWTAQDLANWKSYVDNARSFGVLNLAPMLSEFETVDFATAASTQYIRAAALYGGGIAFDMPGWFFLGREPAYQQSVIAEIKWATANGLRSSITISPEGVGDENFLSDTRQMVAILQAAGALPTQIVVKDEGILGSTGLYSATDPNSLNNVAAWLGTLHLTPSSSESGLEVAGTTARPDDLMTGILAAVTVAGAAAASPLPAAQVFAENAATVATLTVSLSSASLGRLSAGSGGGAVSANGATFTATGTTAQLTAALQTMSFAAAPGAQGSGTLTTTVQDAAGTITGTTTLTVNNELSLSGVPATLSTDYPMQAAQGFTVSVANPSAMLTATITLSDPALAAFWNTGGLAMSADGATLTVTGTAQAIQAAVQQLLLDPAPYTGGTETLTISVTDGTQTVSAATVMTLTPDVLIAATNIPAAVSVSAGSAGEPFADVLISFAADPGWVLGGAITLSAGSAHFVAPSLGAVSQDGLTYTVSGTAAQVQTALRELEVVAPAGSGASTQTATINAEGYTRTVSVQVLPDDTVSVGAPDGTLAGYASGTVAAPLLAAGNVDLTYDYNGVTATAIAGSLGALASEWSGTGAGLFSYTLGTSVAQQTITVRNTGTGTLTIPVGTVAQTANGVQFQVVQASTGNANWIAGSTGDGSLGAFQVAAGASLTLTVEATTPGYTGDVAPNAITALAGVANAQITASAPTLLVQEYAAGSVTLTNTTGSYVEVDEGTALTNKTGSYVIGNDPAAAFYSARYDDDSAGVYYIAPGGSTTVPIYGSNPLSGSVATMLTQIAAQTAATADTLTSTALPSGIAIAGSSAITLTGPTAGQVATYGGWGPNTGVLSGRGYGGFYTNEGLYPTEANSNLSLATNFTQADLSAWKSYVDALRGLGILNVAPALAANGTVLDIATTDATAGLRSAALYGGGIDIDTVPAGILASASALQATIDDIKWAAQNGLRSTVVLRAYGDNTFADESRLLLGKLAAAGALPSQVTVLGSATSTTIPAAELAPAVAQYAASLGLVSSTSEEGLQDGATTAMTIMATGVQNAESTNGIAALAPYAATELFALSAGETVRATVSLDTVADGVLRSANGTVAPDGSLVTLTGTAAVVQAELAAVQYVAHSGQNGSVLLDLEVRNAEGTIQAQTRLASNPYAAQVTALSTTAIPSISPGADGAAAAPSTVSIAGAPGENDVLIATTGGTVTGGTFTVSGDVRTVASALAGVEAAPGPGAAHAQLVISLSGAPQSFTDTDGGRDSISSSGGNVINLGAGNYTVAAGGGDTVSAGSGSVSATATGSSAFTFLGGSSGIDTVTGGAGGGSFTAGTGGRSLLIAGTGTTVLRAAGGNDTLVGGGHTTLYGAAGKANTLSLSGGDTAVGASGSAIIGPTSGSAQVELGAGGETVMGGAGAMTVSGGSGSASISGGLGTELLSLRNGLSAGSTLVWSSFDASRDSIALSGYGSGAAAAAVAGQVTTGGGTLLTLSDGASILLQGVSHLNASSVTSS